jgi:branched-chain amino acid transport system ATP-binding protein
LLELKAVDVKYGEVQALWGIDFKVLEGEIVCLVGSNAAGKTTLLKTISGILRCTSGQIYFRGNRIDLEPVHQIVERGIVQIPEGRKLFPSMTVLENLEMGSYVKKTRERKKDTLENIFTLFPRLFERRQQLASSLSGGEQQMLAIGRGLMAQPQLLMLDEPSLGLAPVLVQRIFEIIRNIRDRGTTVVLVEQNVVHSLKVADRGYVLENGRMVLEGTGKDLLEDKKLKKAYLGH